MKRPTQRGVPARSRGPGRPPRSAVRGANACPDNVRLRLVALRVVERHLPVAFRFIDGDALKRIETELDREIENVLSEVKRAPR